VILPWVYGETPKPIGEVKAGDMVLTRYGILTPVLSVVKECYSGPAIRIFTYQNPPLILMPNDKVTVFRSKAPVEVVKAQDLMIGDMIWFPKPRLRHNKTSRFLKGVHSFAIFGGRKAMIAVRREDYPIFKEVLAKYPKAIRPSLWKMTSSFPRFIPYTPDTMTLCGLFIAYSGKAESDRITLTFPDKNRVDAETFKQLIEQTFKIAYCQEDAVGDTFTLTFWGKTLSTIFSYLCGVDEGSFHLPPKMLGLSPDCLNSLINGLWRGNKAYNMIFEVFNYCTQSRILAHQIRIILASLTILTIVQYDNESETTISVLNGCNESFSKIINQDYQNGSRIDYRHKLSGVGEGWWIRVKGVDGVEYSGECYRLVTKPLHNAVIIDGVMIS